MSAALKLRQRLWAFLYSFPSPSCDFGSDVQGVTGARAKTRYWARHKRHGLQSTSAFLLSIYMTIETLPTRF